MAQWDGRGYRTLHLFAGAGGGLLADLILGHLPVCAVEIDAYCQRVLAARQADGWLPWFPIWDDVTTFDGKPWQGVVDIVAGGFPCQDISVAGKGKGIQGSRSGLWTEFARIVGEIRPRYAFIENVPALTVRGLDRVLADLAALGMDTRWCCLGANDVGAPHIRKRLWILATDPNSGGCRPGRISHRVGSVGEPSTDLSVATAQFRPEMAHTKCSEWGPHDMACRAEGEQLLPQWEESAVGAGTGSEDEADVESGRTPTAQQPGGLCSPEQADWWAVEPQVDRVVDGLADRVVQLRALGNGWVPPCAALAWRILTKGMTDDE
jgi:DNA (cytosine-5)-methyltransferase 1